MLHFTLNSEFLTERPLRVWGKLSLYSTLHSSVSYSNFHMHDRSLLDNCSAERALALLSSADTCLRSQDFTYCSGLNSDVGGPHTDRNIRDDSVSTASVFLVAVSVSFMQLNARSQSAPRWTLDTTGVFNYCTAQCF